MSSNSTLTISLPKQEITRLNRLAIQYGLSLPEFSRRILEELVSQIPEDSFDYYDHPKKLRASFSRAVRDYRYGRTHLRL